jgi:hypothetical protein
MGPPSAETRRWTATFCTAMAGGLVAAGLAAYALAPSFAGDRPGAIVLWALVAAAVLALALATVFERVLAERPPPPGRTPQQSAAAAKIVGFAFREATGLIGATLTFLTGDRLFVVTLGGFALLAMALAWPTRDGPPSASPT